MFVPKQLAWSFEVTTLPSSVKPTSQSTESTDMAYYLEKGLPDREDDDSSTDTTLLAKDISQFEPKKEGKKLWLKPLLFHGTLLSIYTLGFLYAVWSVQNDLGCRKPNIIQCTYVQT
jgi:hypothetical protein